MTRRALLLAAVALTCGLPATSASAADGACPTADDGVTVVVDFQSLGGGTVVRCAPGDPGSGLAALAATGFQVDQVANQPGFVCRIDGRPGTDTEDCADTPPANAYWGYSHAERGGSWSYSGAGAHVRDPAVGTVEGWAFNGDGGSSQPTIPPPPPPAEPEPSPPPSPSPSPRAAPAPTQRSSPTPEPSVAPDGSPAPTDDGTTPAAAADRGTSPPSPAPTDVRQGPAAATPTPAPAPSSPSGDVTPRAAATTGTQRSPWGTVVGGALILLLFVGGVVVRRRRGGEGRP